MYLTSFRDIIWKLSLANNATSCRSFSIWVDTAQIGTTYNTLVLKYNWLVFCLVHKYNRMYRNSMWNHASSIRWKEKSFHFHSSRSFLNWSNIPDITSSHLCSLNGNHSSYSFNVVPLRYNALSRSVSYPGPHRLLQQVMRVYVQLCVWVCVCVCVWMGLFLIWAIDTAHITAQCTSEHPVFKCQLSGMKDSDVSDVWLNVPHTSLRCHNAHQITPNSQVELLFLGNSIGYLFLLSYQCIDKLTAHQITLLIQ